LNTSAEKLTSEQTADNPALVLRAEATPFVLRTPAALAIAAAIGLFLALPFTIYNGAAPVWIGLAPMLWLVCKLPTARLAAACAFVFSVFWVGPSLSFFWHLAAPGVIATTLYTSLFYIAALLLIRKFSQLGIVNAIFAAAAIWPIAEIARTVVPVLSFPWVLLGHPLIQEPRLRQSADLFGVYGLTFLVVLANATLAFAVPAWFSKRWHAVPETTVKSAWKAVSCLFAIMLGAYGYGQNRLDELTPRLYGGAPIALIQGNIVQKLGRTYDEQYAQLQRHMQLHREVLAAARERNITPVLVCWAETMVPFSINVSTEETEQFRKHVKDTGVMTLTGSNYTVSNPDEGGAREHNAAYVLAPDGTDVAHYFKRKLVPFGEYVPWQKSLPLMKYLRSVSRDQYLAGTVPSPIVPVGDYKLAFNLCVEDIHPDLAREAAWSGADVLVNLTNDGWFFGTYGPRAHLNIAAWRAIEVRRPLLRVTNTGWTVAVDPLGKIEVLMPPETESTCTTALVRLKTEREDGPVTLNMRLGELGIAGVFLTLLAACFIFSVRDATPLQSRSYP
jgi:apolipoprotein N-acyltransferase